jgi:hypothetical protein
MHPRVQTILARIDGLKSNHPQLEAVERTRLLRGQARLAENEARCRARELSFADDANDDAKEDAQEDAKMWARIWRNYRIKLGFKISVVIFMTTEALLLVELGLAIHP